MTLAFAWFLSTLAARSALGTFYTQANRDRALGRQSLLDASPLGAEQALATLDTLVVAPIRVDGKRDTVTALSGFEGLPEGCRTEPARVLAHLLLERRGR